MARLLTLSTALLTAGLALWGCDDDEVGDAPRGGMGAAGGGGAAGAPAGGEPAGGAVGGQGGAPVGGQGGAAGAPMGGVGGGPVGGGPVGGGPVGGEPVGGEPMGGAGGEPMGGAGGEAIEWSSYTWPQRDCSVTLRYEGAAGGVVIAGAFTNWAESPLPLQRDGDGFSITLDEGDGLIPGALHAYKFVVDGNWILDPAESHRKFDGDCVNSAFRLPDCSAGPEIDAEPVQMRYADGRGDVTATFRLLSAGDGAAIDAVDITLDGRAVRAADVAVNEGAGTVTVTLSGLEEGRHLISIRAADASGRAAAPVDLPFWVEARPFDWRDATMYMVVVDRFANGDRDIDDPVGAPVQYPADWHGGDLWGVLEVIEAGYFDELGVDALWLSPTNAQTSGHFVGRDDAQQYAAYHGYWPIEGREVDPRFGGNDALQAVVDAAHARGMRVLLDLINNQIHEEHVYFRDHPEWFRTGCVCGIDQGCGWSERPLDCLFAPYLPDINWRDPGAEAQFIDDAIFWIEEFGVDGFRVDAVKHVETNSIYNLRAALTRRFEQGGTRVAMFGETAVGEGDSYTDGCGVFYNNGFEWVDAYTGPNALDGQFDFPTHHRIQYGLLHGNLAFTDLEASMRLMEEAYDPAGVHVRFLGSHDKTRMASQANHDPAVGCRWPDQGVCRTMPGPVSDAAVFQRLRRAFTVLMTIPGIPLIYYGDEVALPGGNDPDNRRDMPWVGDLADLNMPDAGGASLSAGQQALQAWIGALGQARNNSTALTRGRRVPVLVSDDLYIYARRGGGPAEVALVIVNRGAQRTELPITLEGGAFGLADDVASFEAAVGDASVTVDGARLRLTISAGEAAVLLGRQ